MFIFDLFDKIIEIWQIVLITLAYHPWFMLVVPAFFILESVINKIDRNRHQK